MSWDKSLGFARALKDFSEDCSGIGISTLRPSGEGERVAKEIWERDPAVTAMIAGDPVYVDGIMAEARRRGLSIPHDVSVVALGDAPLLSLMKPSVSAIPVPELDSSRGDRPLAAADRAADEPKAAHPDPVREIDRRGKRKLPRPSIAGTLVGVPFPVPTRRGLQQLSITY